MTSRSLILILFVFASTMALVPLSAQDGPAQSSPEITEHVKSFDPAAATKKWLDSVPRDQRQKSDAYFEGGYWLILWNFLLTAAISIVLLFSLISARLRDFSERVTRFKNLQVVCYAVPYFLLVYVLT